MKTPEPMGHYIDLSTRDGATVRTFVEEPLQAPRAVVVVLQHMDQRRPNGQGGASRPPALGDSRPGVNPHVRQMAEAFAREGYLAIAPSTFSRGHSGTDYGYRFEGPLGPAPAAAARAPAFRQGHARRRGWHRPRSQARALRPHRRGRLLLGRSAGLACGLRTGLRQRRGLPLRGRHGGARGPRAPAAVPDAGPLPHRFPLDVAPGHRGLPGGASARKPGARGTEVLVHPGRYGFMQHHHAAYDEALARQVQARTLAFLERELADTQDID